jgi:hypothetical protein
LTPSRSNRPRSRAIAEPIRRALRRAAGAALSAGMIATAPAMPPAAGAQRAAGAQQAAGGQRADRSPGAETPARAGAAGSDRDRYVDLLRKKALADRLATLWKTEADLSAKRTAYAVLDLSDRKLYFKVRGHAFKEIQLTDLDVVKGGTPVDPTELAGHAYTLQLKEGKGVETESIHLKMLTPNEAKAAGISEDAGETLSGAEQGEIVQGAEKKPVAGKESNASSDSDSTKKEKMVGVAGGAIPPDPPAKYHMGFDDNLSIYMNADEAPDPEAARYSWIIDKAKRIGRWFSPAGDDAGEVRITIHLPLAAGQQIFRQILPGQRLLITS